MPKSSHPLYPTWQTMRQRCANPRHVSYPYYGAKGIRVCDRWDDFESFVADMGPRPKGHTLDRIDNSKHYTPENCRWVTVGEQNRNRSNTKLVEYGGTVQTVGAWARQLGIRAGVIHWRIDGLGLPPSLALTLPVDGHATRRALRELQGDPLMRALQPQMEAA